MRNVPDSKGCDDKIHDLLKSREKLTSDNKNIDVNEQIKASRQIKENNNNNQRQSKPTIPNQVPVSRPKPKSKKQIAAEHRKREKEILLLNNEIVEKVKQDEEKFEKRKQADLDKQKRHEEELARKAVEELHKLKETQQQSVTKKTKEGKASKRSTVKKEAEGKEKSLEEDKKKQVQAVSSKQRIYSVREVPPRFALKQQSSQQPPNRKIKMSSLANKVGNSQWSSGSGGESGGDLWRSDDGGWSQGPPATGSGWSNHIESGTSNGSSHQDLGNSWKNPPGSGSDWQQPSNPVIFDRNDKESWPSIGDNSENTSENGDDNVSVKSGSVISNSSSQGQETSQEPSAMQTQGQSASSLWGVNNFNELESNWGISTPSSSAANISGWGSGPNASLSNNNQGYNMQTGASSAGSDSINTINSNPMLGSSRLSWGAPGSNPPNQSSGMASRLPPTQVPRSSAGNNGSGMQGSLPASGAQPNGPQSTQQSGIATGVQSSGPNSLPVSQGTSAFPGTPGFSSKTPVGSDASWSTSSGFVVNPGTSIMNTSSGNNAQSGDNLTSGWGTPSSSDNSSTAISGAGSWGNPNLDPGSDWGSAQQSASMSQPQHIGASANPSQQIQPSSNSQFTNPNTSQGQQNPADQQRPSSWAQAAGKGLNFHSNTNTATNAAAAAQAQADLEKETKIREAIENHDGWGKKPIRQDTKWNIETSPKAPRKISTATVVADPPKGTNNMWNNNNGTAIWEPTKDGSPAWNSAGGVARAPGQRPAQQGWNGAVQKPPEQPGGNWGGANSGVGSAPVSGQASDKGIGSWGNPEGNQSSNNGNWGGSTETGSWGGNYGPRPDGNGGSISTWGEPDNPGWNDPNRRSGSNDGTSYWGEPQGKPPQQNWNNPSGPPSQASMGQRIKSDEWNSANKPLKASGWGDPIGPPDPKVDDGTSLWAANNQQQACAAGWGDTARQGPWNPAMGKSRPPLTQGSGWAGDGDMNWNSSKDDVWNEENMGGWDDADMGTWNDVSQENNSSWNSATGWNRNKRNSLKGGPMKFPGGCHPPQMRSRLLQQLMDMGFKKDDAQHALITNNMNLQGALGDLYSRQGPGASKKDLDMDVFQMDGAKKMTPGLLPDGSGVNDDISSDTQSDSNSFVPNINSMQNTPFQNAQSQLPNQFPYKEPSLSQSSLNPNNPSINMSLQQKIMQKLHNQQQPPPPPTAQNSINQTQGQIGVGQLPGNQIPAVQNQMAQQEILRQLRLAVQAGLIDPQLLNQQLPPPVLVKLQQLLQNQQMLQQLLHTQYMLQSHKMGGSPLVQRQQLEQIAVKINNIKPQILLVRRQLSQVQNSLLKPQQQQQQQQQVFAQQTSASEADPLTTLPSDIGNISISTSQPQAQSRLNQWKRPTPERETPPVSDVPSTTSGGESSGSLNKAVGSKPIQQSQSTPNLRRFDELGLSQLGGGDWSTTPTSSAASLAWHSSGSPTSNISPTEVQTSSAENKESQSSTTTTATTSSSSVLNINDSIPEFIPGKPWQGMTSKNVEDDPYITPGSISRSFSVNTIKDDYLSTLTKTSPSENTSSWPSKPVSSSSQNKTWSPAESLTPNEVWGGFPKGNTRPPPGLPTQQNKTWGRQNSWAPGMKTDAISTGPWERPSTALILKNLTPQMDGSTLRTVCMQHGPLQGFYLNLGNGQALVKYSTKDEAIKAQKALNTCLLGNTTIVAEFVPENEIARFVDHQSAMSAPSQWSQSLPAGTRPAAPGSIGSRSDGNSSWNLAAPTSSFNNPLPASSGSGNMWGTGMGGGSGGGSALWGSTALEDHSTNNLLGNMLGETM